MRPFDQAAIMRLKIYDLSKKMKDWQDQLSKRIYTGCECLIYKTALGLNMA